MPQQDMPEPNALKDPTRIIEIKDDTGKVTGTKEIPDTTKINPDFPNTWVLRAKHIIEEKIDDGIKTIRYQLHYHHPRTGKWDTSLIHTEVTDLNQSPKTEASEIPELETE